MGSTLRCDSCGKFSKGPFQVESRYGDSSTYSSDECLIAPCCQTPADRGESFLTIAAAEGIRQSQLRQVAQSEVDAAQQVLLSSLEGESD